MSEESPKPPKEALIIGDSPTLLYISYALTNNDYKVAVFPYRDKSANNITATTIIALATNYVFIPYITITNLVRLSSYIGETETKNQTFKYIFINTKFVRFLKQCRQFFSNVMEEETIIFFDATGSHFDIDQVLSLFPNSVVLTIFSKIDCRLVDLHTNTFLSVDETYSVIVGSIPKTCSYETVSCLNLNSAQGNNLAQIKQLFENSFPNGKLQILAADSHKIFKKMLWDDFVSRVCFKSISIAYDEPVTERLLTDKVALPVINGMFQEIALISKGLLIKYADITPAAVSKYYNSIAALEAEAETNRKNTIGSRIYLPKYMESNHLFYSFSQGHELDISQAFTNLLTWADKFQVDAPFLESVSGFIAKAITIRDGKDFSGKTKESTLFAAKNYRNDFIKLFPINGIPPEKNMMNFPPFYPKPTRRPPNNFRYFCMVITTIVERKDVETEEADSIDQELTKLVQGTEKLTYGEDVFLVGSCSKSPEVPAALKTKRKLAFTETSSTPSPINLPPAAAASTTYRDDRGNHYIRQQDGTMSPLTRVSITPISALQQPVPTRVGALPETIYHHIPIANTRKSSQEKLRDAQFELADRIVLKGQAFQSGSRYGDLDSLKRNLKGETDGSGSSGRFTNGSKESKGSKATRTSKRSK